LNNENHHPLSKHERRNAMKTRTIVGIAACGLLCLPALSLSQDLPVTGEGSVAFPPSFKCSTNSPCRNITGEILRIEESYWIQDPEGGETHVKVTRNTKMEEVPKVGDKIAAQLTSKGEANAIVKLAEIPKPKDLPAPSHAQKDFRESQSNQPAVSGQAKQGQDHIKQSDAEAGGKMQSLDPQSGGGNMNPSERPTR
jgi:hypothetical protein